MVFISALMALSAGCASGGKAELPVYDTLDGHFDKTLMTQNLLKINNGDPGGLYVSEAEDSEYGGYCYVALTTINNNISHDKYVKAAFEIYRSRNMSDWEMCGAIDGSALGIPADSWIDTWTWAPELVRDPDSGLYLLYFSAHSKVGNQGTSYISSTAYQYDRMYLSVAVSETPVGPYEQVTTDNYYKALARLNEDGSIVTQDGWVIGKDGDRLTAIDDQGHILNLNGDRITYADPVINFGSQSALKYIEDMNAEKVFPAIDASFFRAENGEMYLYFVSHLSSAKEKAGLDANGYTLNRNEIWGMKMKDYITPDYSTLELLVVPGYETARAQSRIDEENGTELRKVSLDGSKFTLSGDADVKGGAVNEAPYMLEHNGKYYLCYAPCGTGSREYSICQAVSDSPLGPFVKLEKYNPVIGINDTNDYMSCTGHNSFVKIGDEIWALYHTFWNSEVPNSGRCLAADRVQFVYFEEVGFDVLCGNGPTIAPQPAPEAYTGYTNVAKAADISATNAVKGTIDFLTDGLIPVQEFIHDREFKATKTTKITLTWEQPQEITALFVYNSADYYYAFDKIDKIVFELAESPSWCEEKLRIAEITDLMFNTDYMSDSGMFMRQGGAAIASFNPIKVKKMTIEISSKFTNEYPDGGNGNKQINVSELYIMGKEG